ncbi:MAG TPA: PorP/SprF family type IX secretion system membrane protein [Anditalea sp.]|nr:PorP/SprF family type IX secretion system membrane protein [Anditalea sp.]
MALIRKIGFSAILCFWMTRLFAQDLQYSQFYAAPLYLNPAMTGATELTRVGFNYRKQWPGLNFDFTGYSAYIDHYSYDRKSGFGLAVNSFQESNMNIKFSDISLLYSYNLHLSNSSNIRFGAQTAIVQRDALLSSLLMGDQVDVFSSTVSPSSIDNLPDMDPFRYVDFSIGMLYQHKSFWFGTSAHHLNRPNMSFYRGSGADNLPIKYNVHAGVQIEMSPGRSPFAAQGQNYFNLVANYKNQGPFQQLDLSGQVLYQSMLMGVGYRGIPGTKELPNRDSVVLLLGVNLEGGMIFGYSFDYMVSRLGMVTHGAHEVSLRYQFLAGDPKTRNRKSRALKCFQYLM